MKRASFVEPRTLSAMYGFESFEPRTSSVSWRYDYKNDYDPSIKIEKSMFEEQDPKWLNPTQGLTTQHSLVPHRTVSNDFSSLFQSGAAEPEVATSHWFSTNGALEDLTSGYSNEVMSNYDAITQSIVRDSSEEQDVTPPSSPEIVKSFETLQVAPDASIKKERSSKARPKTVKNNNDRIYVDKANGIDILCGKGGLSNRHPGNLRYRDTINKWRSEYLDNDLTKTEKTKLSLKIVDIVMAEGGRFLKMDKEVGKYYVLSRKEARRKTVQGLREKKEFSWTSPEKCV